MIYLDGALLEERTARIDVRDRGLLLGDGLFETMLARHGRIFRLVEHIARLEEGCRRIGIELVPPPEGWPAMLGGLLAANQLEAADAAVRLTITRGCGPRGLLPPADASPTIVATAGRLEAFRGPAVARVATLRRNEHSPLSNLKSLSFLENVLAYREAAAHGADEAILLNTAGRVAEASSANVFLVMRDGVLVTPPTGEGALAGITRGVILELARELEIEAHERPIATGELGEAAEAFLSSSLVGVRALVGLDGAAIGSGHPGPLTQQLGAAYERLVDFECCT